MRLQPDLSKLGENRSEYLWNNWRQKVTEEACPKIQKQIIA